MFNQPELWTGGLCLCVCVVCRSYDVVVTIYLCRWQLCTKAGKECILIHFSKGECHERYKENEENGEGWRYDKMTHRWILMGFCTSIIYSELVIFFYFYHHPVCNMICITLYIVYISVPINTANIYEILAIKPEGKRSFVRLRRRRESIINMHVQGTEYEAVEWINLAQDRIRWLTIVYGITKRIRAYFFLATSPFIWSTSKSKKKKAE
jgi:hypothetical protein